MPSVRRVHVNLFPRADKDRAIAFAKRKNKYARKYRYIVSPYRGNEGWEVRPVKK